MKKIVTICTISAMLLVSLFAITGCKNKEENKEENTQKNEVIEETNRAEENTVNNNQNTTYSNPQNATVINNGQVNNNPQAKSKLCAGLLGIFLGAFGIHNFYLGYTTKAVVQLLVSIIGGLITCGIATVAIEIWGLVEGIMILTGSIATDANGVTLKD